MKFDHISFLRRQKEIFESVFPANFFARRGVENHPVYRRWKICKEMIEGEAALTYDWLAEHSYTIARMLRDVSCFTTVSGGDISGLQLGDTSLYERMKMLETEDHFESLMLEIEIAAWYKWSGFEVELIAQDGLPDIRANWVNDTRPIYIECKRLEALTENAVKANIKKANNQLKNVAKVHGLREENYTGIVILDAAGVSGLTTMVRESPTLDDFTPQPVLELIGVATNAVNGSKNRSVGCVVVIWDEDQLIGVPPNRTLMLLIRRVSTIFHSPDDVRSRIDGNSKVYEGSTISSFSSWHPSMPATFTSWGPPRS